MPTSQIHCLGFNHRTAPVELRELFSSPLVDPEQVLFPGTHGRDMQERGGWGDADPVAGCPYHAKARTSGDVIRARRVKNNGSGVAGKAKKRTPTNGNYTPIREVTIFATCNRMELYACVDPSTADPKSLLLGFLSTVYDVEAERLNGHCYHYTGLEAIAHLCHVASGLDSQVLGETQILGQVTGAYENALETITAGPYIQGIFRAAIRAGKRARSETTISSNPASMSSVAISTAQDVLGSLQNRNILVVGMGEMGMLTLRALHARQLQNICVANRSPERAKSVAEHWGFRIYSLDELEAAISDADAVITSTAAPDPVIGADTVRRAMEKRRGRDLVIVDIAVPRDVEPAVADLPGVHLYDADDLKVSLDRSLAARKKEIPRVEAIIAEETAKCEVELRELSLSPVISDLREKAESIRLGELERTIRRLHNVDPETLEHIHYMSRAIVNKLLHEPTVRLKRSARAGLHNELTSTVRHLFDLPESDEN